MKTFEDLTTDFVNQPITGWLKTGDYLEVPLISHIEDNLYVGGCRQGVDLGDFFSHVFSLYKWERYVFDPEATTFYEVEMFDSGSNPIDVKSVELFSDRAAEALTAGGNVLIHCQAGINRSNLVAARTLMKWKGLTARDAIGTLRSNRDPNVLCNRLFERWLLSLDRDLAD